MIKGILLLLLDQFKLARLRPIIWSMLIVLLLGFGIQCIKHSGHPSKSTTPIIYKGARLIIPEHSALRSVITLEVVHPRSVVSSLTLPATVRVIHGNTVKVFPPLTGQIERLYKTVGDDVHVGDPLYSLISADLAQAVSDRSNAQAAYNLSQQTLKRQQQLMGLDIGALHDLQQAQSDDAKAWSELERARARLSALHVSEEDHDTLGHLIVRSPINGVVTDVNAGVGSYWSDVTSEVLTVADLSQISVVAFVQEHDVHGIFSGQEVEVVLDGDGSVFSATVEHLEPLIDPDTRTVSIEIILSNAERHFKPNMFATVILKSKPRDLVVLPLTAVIQRGFDSVVFVEVAPWQFESRIVEVGPQIGDQIEIESGLAQNDKVVLTGGIILND